MGNKVKCEIELELPEGYSRVEFRKANPGDLARSWSTGKWTVWNSVTSSTIDYFVAIPDPKWRPATIDDLKRAPIPARFQDARGDQWTHRDLHGYIISAGLSIGKWECRYGEHWKYCEVQE